jgi:2-succinyl-6-hydroxy-2,4-cyclohexadiene-1-carboxylate synthase
VHGFTQNRNCWGPVAADLASDHEVVRVDAPGHGKSATVAADLPAGAELIARRGGDATYIGYSMGARFVLHVALARPEQTRALVLIGATAGIDDADARDQRKQADEQNAERLERDGVDRFLTSWLAQPLFAGLSEPMQFRDQRATNTVEGLASSLRLAGTGSQQPLCSRLHELAMPVLAIAGENDTKFTMEAERLVGSIGPNATMALVPGGGHAAHLEQPDAFVAIVRRWLEANDL